MPFRPAAARPLAACAALAVLLTVSGCDLVEEVRREREAAATPSAPPAAQQSSAPGATAPAADGPRAERHTTTLTTGGASLEIAAPAAAVVTADGAAGLQTVTLDLAPGDVADLTLTSPGALDVDSDGSVTVLDGAGTPVAAFAPPAAPPGTAATAPRLEVTDVDATHARLEVDDRVRPGQGNGGGSGTGPVRYTVAVGDQAIEGMSWGNQEGGRSLALDPADWARVAGEAGLDLIRTQLLAAEPEADSATMDHQLVCHAVGAVDKATWNLEPWRPDVGLILTATAHCNPV
ncbi:DUF2599 domain-containing protein [Promicromonospora thailandica]|uniref:DUF2599 domain-containing protein n=1 Tax=Promicromonospora thailandica TaxID=765201 RepID=UPI0020A44480|nr:DUF2599 domain-containing protein [Promicromonospora thailandica]BFF19395.1 hypothetical protein GCM10025730_29160 [Promicromonospora thailandica]